MAPRTDKYTDKAVEMCIATGCTPRAAYDAVKAEHRSWGAGEAAIQNIRKRAREGREAEAAAEKPKPKPKPKQKPKAKKKAYLPKGKRLRTDQVDAIAADKEATRRNRSEAHKKATAALVKLRTDSGQVQGWEHGRALAHDRGLRRECGGRA